MIPATVRPGSSYAIGIVLDPAPGTPAAATRFLAVLAGSLSVDTAELPDAVMGEAYVQQLVAHGGDGTYSWSLIPGLGKLPAGIELADSGLLNGVPADGTVGVYDFGVQVKSGSATYPAIFILNVTDRAPLTIVVSDSCPVVLEAEGGTPPYTWEVKATAGGTIVRDPDHPNIIEGTPNLVGAVEVTATVTDADGVSATKDFWISCVVRGANPAVQILTTTLQPATTGEDYQQGYLDAQNGDAQTYHWTASPLPPGMVLDADTMRARIHGVPTEIGSWVIHVSVVDGDGNEAESVVGLEVDPFDYLHSRGLATTSPGALYKEVIAADGGTDPVVYRILSGSLPSGLALDADGTIHGQVDQDAKPAAYTFSVEARDAVNHVGIAGFAIYVDNPVKVAPNHDTGCSSSGGGAPAGLFLALALARRPRRTRLPFRK